MPKVSNLQVKPQTGSDQVFATWEFNESTHNTVASTSVKAGDLVSIASNATWYNGVAIDSWVFSERWYVREIIGDRAVVDQNEAGTNWISSPINVAFLIGGSGGSSEPSVDYASTLDHYAVEWSYYTGDSVWFSGASEDVTEKLSLYTPPDNALQYKVKVTPVAKTHKVNDEDVAYWTGTSEVKTGLTVNLLPEVPPTPDVVIEEYKLTATIENISDERTDKVQFELMSGYAHVSTTEVWVKTCRAVMTANVNVGNDYRVRVRAVNLIPDGKNYSEWSDYTDPIGTVPAAPSKITSVKATSETSIRLTWNPVSNAETYEIQYVTDKDQFQGSDQIQSVSGIETTTYEISGLESGNEYFFRVRAVNEQGESAWSAIASGIVGETPAAPTTWSSTTTVVAGDPLTLFWVHNSVDGSIQQYADIEMYVNGVKESHTIRTPEGAEEEDVISYYEVDTSTYKEGTTIEWRVRTSGITLTYSEWSVQRKIDVYAPATLQMDVTDQNGGSLNTITTFPFYIKGLAGPKTQEPTGYHVSIVSNNTYQTVDAVGNFKMVNAGEEVYSKYFDTSNQLVVEMLPSNIDLENSMSYTVTVIVSMNSGLTAQATKDISVSWQDLEYEPDAEIGIDTNTWSAYIRPYCIDSENNPITDVTLGVYRREYDGTYKAIQTGIEADSNAYITDPHPALDYARYRITATSKETGAVSFYDVPNYPVHCVSAIIQWNESWSNFAVNTGDRLEEEPWSGSMIKIPYNIDVSDSNSPDSSLVNYIGREYPVSYYGTQIGTKSSWSMEIPKADKDTLYLLRKLSRYMGDVYVREPSGSGYWASVTVSFSQTHCEVTIPVSLDITRVEGGV